MSVNEEDASATPPTRKRQRPSRSRGLRTSTGCQTCRNRRVKCDETRPYCRQCQKGHRECSFARDQLVDAGIQAPRYEAIGQSIHTQVLIPAQSITPATSANVGTDATSVLPRRRSKDATLDPHPVEADHSANNSPPSVLRHHCQTGTASGAGLTIPADVSIRNARITISTVDITRVDDDSTFSPGAATLEWYDLLVQDAIRSIQQHNLSSSINTHASSDQHSSVHDVFLAPPPPRRDSVQTIDGQIEPWKSVERLDLQPHELGCLKYFIESVAPMLDLFDKDRHYAVEIPHLALHNVGLLKSVLAVAARHMVLHGVRIPDLPRDEASGSQQATRERHLATQFYHETLAYLSKAMAYPSYTGSVEILGTASMIGVYEMFDGSNRDWERHLKGTFWIQRCQNTNGESGGLRMAVWWAWLRQDIWAAFRDKRRTLTIWRPTKPLCALPPEELATRILYILAKVVQYASHEEASTTSIAARIEQGDQLLRSLQDWDQTLPSSFRPINYKTSQEPFAEQWIHPPSHAVAVQCYHCARIIMLLNQPSVGGIAAYSGRQSMLDESVDTICGIAKSHLSLGRMPLLTISFQCMFAAGLCVQPDRWAAFFKVFDETLELNKWPPKEATMELLERWGQSE